MELRELPSEPYGPHLFHTLAEFSLTIRSAPPAGRIYNFPDPEEDWRPSLRQRLAWWLEDLLAFHFHFPICWRIHDFHNCNDDDLIAFS